MLLAGLAAVWIGIAPSAAAEPKSARWSFGWDGVVVLGRWVPATVEFTLDVPAECRVELSALDAEGHTATFVSPPEKLPVGQQRLTGFFQCGRIDSSVRARLLTSGTVDNEIIVRPGQTDRLQPFAKLADRLIVTAGQPRGFDQLARAAESSADVAVHVIAREAPADLPTDPRSYDSVHWVVLAGSEPVSRDVSQALREWVADGGRVLLSLPKQVDRYQQSSLKEWLPVRVGEQPVLALDLGRLEDLAGRSVRIPVPPGERQAVARLEANAGVVLASSRDDPLLYRAPYGFGEVYVLGMDLTQPPLARWLGLPDFIRNLLEIPEASSAHERRRAGLGARQLTSTGISDLASQVQACQDHFPAVERPSPWWTMGWMLGLLVLVGPLDYLLVHRVLRRPHATWFTLPVCLIAAALLAARSAQSSNTSVARSNQLDVVDVDAASQRYRVQCWSTVFSPTTAREDVVIGGSAAHWAPLFAGDRPAHPRISWSSIPETVFGGLYRPGGTEWGRTEYRVFPDQQRIEALPLLQWSSRTMTAQWSGTAEGADDSGALVTSELQSTGLGRLTGTITHHLPGEITAWILAFGNRAYRRQPSRDEETSVPWPAGEPLTVDHPLVFQRELRGVLTRAVTHREQREGTKGSAIRETQTRYDPLDRDPLTAWHLLTFHEAAGGTDYSTLTNHLLTDHDLTRQLQLGRAVLFGRLSAPAPAEVQRGENRESPDRQEVFVRLVMPVRRSVDVLRELPKLDK